MKEELSDTSNYTETESISSASQALAAGEVVLGDLVGITAEGQAKVSFSVGGEVFDSRIAKTTQPLKPSYIGRQAVLMFLDQDLCQPIITGFIHGSLESFLTVADDVGAQDVSTQDVSTQDVSTQDVSTQDVSTQDVSTQDVSTQDVSTQDVSTQDVSTQDVSTQDVSTQDVSTQDSNEDQGVFPSEPEAPLTVKVDADQEKKLFLEGKDEVVLKCGEASITLTRQGKVILRGKYILSRSSGVNRILGGSVQVN
ncbi:DUF6484 domain-containing protein [Teredinibacter franksiae]|uniref:DUF6484 domain-containing protein n=1 Tax=Teredinibacter franksiae TaxID=2761453 RepID=UPI00162732ED|nr:DUF6484 domain-containing protein [Teredinibacter franksiae]